MTTTIRPFPAAALLAIVAACGGGADALLDAGSAGGADADTTSSGETVVVTAVGAPTGAAVTQAIGAAGGTVTEPTSGASVEVVAGSLDATADVTLQPVANMLPAGIGGAVAISVTEAQRHPLIVRFAYGAEVSDPSQLIIAVQAEDGSWRALYPMRVDALERTISVALPVSGAAKPAGSAPPRVVTRTWGFLMNPASATVRVGESVALKPYAVVSQRVPCPGVCLEDGCELSSLCSNSLIDELPFTNDKDGFTRQWFVNERPMGDGVAGTVQPSATAGAVYTAPARKPAPDTVLVKFLSTNDATGQEAPAFATVKIIDECDGSAAGKRPQVCVPPRWTGTASEDAMLGDPVLLTTLSRRVRASVTWNLQPGDTTRTIFEATGTATYSATGQQGPCTIHLPETTLPISGRLQFVPSGTAPSYLASGSNPVGAMLCYEYSCPEGSFSLCGQPPPWLGTGLEPFSPTATTISGTHDGGGGIIYSWSFARAP